LAGSRGLLTQTSLRLAADALSCALPRVPHFGPCSLSRTTSFLEQILSVVSLTRYLVRAALTTLWFNCFEASSGTVKRGVWDQPTRACALCQRSMPCGVDACMCAMRRTWGEINKRFIRRRANNIVRKSVRRIRRIYSYSMILQRDTGRLRLSQGASLKTDESEGCSSVVSPVVGQSDFA
jgi:hypothetical protein